MNKVKSYFKNIVTFFLVILVVLVVYTYAATNILKKDYANVFGYSYFVVATRSMSGTIEANDVILVKLTENVKIDDIITYRNEDGDIITHRVIDKDGSYYICKGDANNTEDIPITKKQIIGKVKMIISPSLILKVIAMLLILVIFFSLSNFDKILKEYIARDDTYNKKLPNDLFANPNKKDDDQSTGLTVTIAFNEMEKLSRAHDREAEREEEIEILDFDEYLDSSIPKNKQKKKYEKETIDLVVSILKCKKSNITKARMNKKWLVKYQYVYKMCHLLLEGDTKDLVEEVNHPSFKEIYDYDLERVGLTETIRNRIYEMPIHIFLRIMTYSILYNDEEMFDGVYKILKYKVMIDKANYFKEIKKTDTYSMKQVKTLISFMEKVSAKFDNKNVFDLDKIARLVKIRNY